MWVAFQPNDVVIGPEIGQGPRPLLSAAAPAVHEDHRGLPAPAGLVGDLHPVEGGDPPVEHRDRWRGGLARGEHQEREQEQTTGTLHGGSPDRLWYCSAENGKEDNGLCNKFNYYFRPIAACGYG